MVTTNLNPDGAPLSQFELATALAGPEFEITIVASTDGALREAYEKHSIPIFYPSELHCNVAVPAWYEADVISLAEILRKNQPDLIVASTIDSFPVIDAARIAGIPSVWNIRESEPWKSRLAHLHPIVASRALACLKYPEAVIFVARASQIAWSAFASPERSHVIYNAPHPSLLSSEMTDLPGVVDRAEGKTLIANVGTLCERKGQIDLARALSKLPRETLRRLQVVFAGRNDSDYMARVQSALAPAAAAVSTFVGPVANGCAIVGAADLLVHTARSEAFPRVLLEAAALGTPIIATAVDGAVERLEDGQSAILYEPKDIRALVGAIRKLVEDPHLREKLKSGAYRALVTNHTFGDMLASYREHIVKAVNVHANTD